MATTDFLLQPAAQPSRGQAGSADRAAHQRPTEAGSAFSAVYAQQQQRTAKAQQQQSQQQRCNPDSACLVLHAQASVNMPVPDTGRRFPDR